MILGWKGRAVTSAPSTVPVVRSLPAPGGDPCGLTSTRGLLWCADRTSGRIRAVRPHFGQVEVDLACERLRGDLTDRDGLLHQIGDDPAHLLTIDPASGEVVDAKPLGTDRVRGIQASRAGLWTALRDPAVAQLRDPDTLAVLRELPLSATPSGLTCVNALLVYSEQETGLVRVVDTKDERVVGTARVEGVPVGMAWDGYSLWYADVAGHPLKGNQLKAVRLDDVLHGERWT
jgi:hypothetical protein